MTRPEWRISDGLVPYDEAVATMEARQRPWTKRPESCDNAPISAT